MPKSSALSLATDVNTDIAALETTVLILGLCAGLVYMIDIASNVYMPPRCRWTWRRFMREIALASICFITIAVGSSGNWLLGIAASAILLQRRSMRRNRRRRLRRRILRNPST